MSLMEVWPQVAKLSREEKARLVELVNDDLSGPPVAAPPLSTLRTPEDYAGAANLLVRALEEERKR